MNLEEIKNIILEKKKYLVIILIVLGLFVFYKKANSEKTDNSFLTENSQQSKKQVSDNKDSLQSSSDNKNVTCDISGAVNEQGVYTLKNGARLQDLIDAAGGLKSRAQLKAINRALLLKDQDKIYIPYKGEKVEAASTVNSNSGTNDNGGSNKPSSSGDKVNLNTASAADLQKLNGIGEKKAEQIIAYREQKGQFKKIEDLKEVSGIGDKTFAALKDHLEV